MYIINQITFNYLLNITRYSFFKKCSFQKLILYLDKKNITNIVKLISCHCN